MACNERVGRGTITWPCSLDTDHPGPHFAVESTASQGDRRRWLADRAEQERQAASGLGQFQGPAETTAQRYTENPTPVPVSSGRARLHQGCSSAECLVYDGEPPTRLSAYKECPYGGAPPARIPSDAVVAVEQQASYTAVLDKGTSNEEAVLITEFGDRVEIMRGAPAGSNGGEVTVQSGLKQRPEDQPLPVTNDYPDIQSQVIADIEKRRQVGISRYGTALQPHNGRDMLLDLYEELMDALIYTKGVMIERDNPR